MLHLEEKQRSLVLESEGSDQPESSVKETYRPQNGLS